MKYTVELSVRTQIHIYESMDWYNSKLKGLGGEFYSEILETFEVISKNPEAFRFRYKIGKGNSNEAISLFSVLHIDWTNNQSFGYDAYFARSEKMAIK